MQWIAESRTTEFAVSRLATWCYWIVLVACMLGALVMGLRQTGTLLDDAFITYRYAYNLSAGRGFVFNPGEAVLGTTTPLFGILLGLLHLAGADIPQAGHLISALGWSFCAGLVALIGRAVGQRGSGLVAAIFVATCPLFLDTIGMETSLVIAVCLGAFYLYLTGRSHAAFAVAGLAILLRPDCALVALVLSAAYCLERRALPWKEGLFLLAVILPWVIYAQGTYGSPLPNSFFAKAGQGHNQLLGGTEIGTFARGFVGMLWRFYDADRTTVMIAIFAVIGLVRILALRSRLIIIVVWAILYGISYTVLAVLAFPWYYAPVVPAVGLMVGAGITWLAGLTLRIFPRHRALQMGVAVLLALALGRSQIRASTSYQVPQSTPYHLGYRAVADWLRTNTPEHASVALTEIGTIGYYSDRQVIDTMGLVSPDITRHLYSWYQTLAYTVATHWPDYAVALQGTAWDAITATPWFEAAYSPVVVIPSKGPGSRKATIYQRRDDYPIAKHDIARTDRLSASNGIALLAAYVQPGYLSRRNVKESTRDGQLHVQLDWAAAGHISEDYQTTVEIISVEDGQHWQLAHEQPLHGGNPTFLWHVGERVNATYALDLPPDLPPGRYMVEATLSDSRTGEVLPLKDQGGHPVPHVAVGPVRLEVGPAPEEDKPAIATFGDAVALLGFEVPHAVVSAGSPIEVRLHWTSQRQITEDYTVFVHVLDESGRIVAQHDGQPVGGGLPTSLWSAGLTVADVHHIVLPDKLLPGQYFVQVGLYRFETGERLPVQSSPAGVKDNAVPLTPIAVR